MTARFVIGDTRDVVATIPDGSIDFLMSSPPFLALRSYLPADHPEKHREIGSESDPAAFIDTLLELTAGWRRVLARHGSICVELGDTYSGSGDPSGCDNKSGAGGPRWQRSEFSRQKLRGPGWPLAKSLALVPELYRIALAYGVNPLTGAVSPAGRWRVRNVVRWVRPNPPVGALGDKFRPATSDLVVACVASDRWFDLDAVRTPLTDKTLSVADGLPPSAKNAESPSGHHRQIRYNDPAGAPPLDWWNIPPRGYDGSHYAVYPPELCVRPIEAMCPRRVCRTCGQPSWRETENPNAGHGRNPWNGTINGETGFGNRPNVHESTTTGWSSCGCPGTDGLRLDGYHTGSGWRPGIVLDPFVGTGTTLLVATGHGRDAIGIDLDPRNADLATERLGMFLTVEQHTPEAVA